MKHNNNAISGLTTPKNLKAPSPKLTAPALTAPSSFINLQKTIAASANTEKYTQANAFLGAFWRSDTQFHQTGSMNRTTN